MQIFTYYSDTLFTQHITLLAKDCIAEIKDKYDLRTTWYISGQVLLKCDFLW